MEGNGSAPADKTPVAENVKAPDGTDAYDVLAGLESREDDTECGFKAGKEVVIGGGSGPAPNKGDGGSAG
jgi:hypothetical protein